LTVARATLQVSSTSVSFASTAALPVPPPQSTVVTNVGTSTMTGVLVSAVSYGAGQPTGWLTATDPNGVTTLTAGAALSVQMSVAPGTLAAGTYTARYTVSATNATNGPFTVNVTLTVAGLPPTIVVTPATVTFTSTAAVPQPANQTALVTNVGSATLTGVLISPVSYGAGQPAGWLSASGPNGVTSLAAGATLSIQMSVAPGTLPAGTYTASYAVSATNATNGPATVNVILTVAGPTLQLGSTSVGFASTAALPVPPLQSTTLTNIGSSTMTGVLVSGVSYDAGQPTGWLTASAPIGVTTLAPGAALSIQMNAAPGTLPAGTYTASYTVSASNATNGPLTVNVTFIVAGPPPTIVMTPGTVMLSMQARAPSTRSTTVQITNGIAGVLSGLAVQAPIYVSNSGWLSATLGSTNTPTVLTLRGSTRTLGAGVYLATVPLSATSAATVPLVVTLEVVDLRASERALTDPTQLSSAERTRLDQLGNNDGSYNLGDYVALRARLGLTP